ncbi:hypothetical protein F8388_004302 [Cannabis sativa]|uniref:Uncharacterized protein n=1 Tax=Cannabis sativa TaxID=3483 RepID=A0A7J6H9K8_CANSA|nr:hypothetical protein F8388_004302 [Cannabis sativa]
MVKGGSKPLEKRICSTLQPQLPLSGPSTTYSNMTVMVTEEINQKKLMNLMGRRRKAKYITKSQGVKHFEVNLPLFSYAHEYHHEGRRMKAKYITKSQGVKHFQVNLPLFRCFKSLIILN